MNKPRAVLNLVSFITLSAAAIFPNLALSEDPGSEAGASLTDLGLDDLDPNDELGLDLEGFDIFDEFALLAAEDMVVSASRRRQRIQESPSAITVITHEQILASGYDNLLDLMRLVPGADVYRITQGTGSLGLRSNSDWAGENLLVLVDGRDVAIHLFGLPMWMAMPFDVESIERIEVIRGPGSTLYGANALQGVVNIVTRNPGDSPFTGEATGSTAGLNTTSINVRAHGRVGSWGYWGNAGWDRRAPYALPGEVASEVFRGRLLMDWHSEGELTARIETGLVRLEGGMTTFVGDGPFEVFWPYVLGSLSIGRSQILALIDSNDSRLDLDFGLVLPDDSDNQVLGRVPLLLLPTRSAELTAHHSIDLFKGNTLMVGGSARLIHHIPSTVVICPEVPFADFHPSQCYLADVLEMRLGLFLQNEWYLHQDLLLNLGGRLDHNSLNAEPGFSPRAALVYSHPAGHAARLGYGRAYRKPTLAETDFGLLLELDPSTPEDLGLRLQSLFSQIGSRDLLNEFMDSFEVGLQGRFFEDRLNVTIDAFVAVFHRHIHSVLHNLELVPGFSGVDTLPHDARLAIDNMSHALYAHGGELQVVGKPLPRLTLTGSYALDRMYVPEVDPESGEATWHLSKTWEPHHRLIGSVRVSAGKIRAGLDALWFSRYDTNTRNPESVLAPDVITSVGATTLINAQLSYRFSLRADRSVELGMAALNLLDSPYREVGGYDVDGKTLGGGEILARRGRLFLRGSF